MDRKRWLVVGLALLAGVIAVAADAPAMPKPTAEHEALGWWVGTWEGKGEMKPGPFGPGGPMSWTEECSWFGNGKFQVVCRSKGTGPMGPMHGLGIVAYDAQKKVYTHYGVDDTGWAGLSEGERDGEAWTFRSREVVGGKTYQGRFQMRPLSDNEFSFEWAMSEDGQTWTTMMAGKTKKR